MPIVRYHSKHKEISRNMRTILPDCKFKSRQGDGDNGEGRGGGGEGRWNCEARGKTGRRAGGEGSEGARGADEDGGEGEKRDERERDKGRGAVGERHGVKGGEIWRMQEG